MLKCKICGFVGKSLVSHLRHKHKMSTDHYRKKFPNEKVHLQPPCSDEQKKKMSKILKKVWDENKEELSDKCSCWKQQFWIDKGLTEEEAIKKISKIQKENSKKVLLENRRTIWNKQFWIDKGLTEEEAIKKISKIQKENSKKSSKFKGHKHNINSRKKISKSILEKIYEIGVENWTAHFGDFKTNFRSKPEIEIFEYSSSIIANITANEFIGGKNVDILFENKIIEVFGDYWHCNPKQYSEFYYNKRIKKTAKEIWNYDKEKIQMLNDKGYETLIIWESDWNKNQKIEKQKIRSYLENKGQNSSEKS